MACVFKFKHYSPDSPSQEPVQTSDKAQYAKSQSCNGERPKLELAPEDPAFDWGQHQDFHFINTDKDTLYVRRDRKQARAHVMNDLNKKERLKRKFRNAPTSSPIKLRPRIHQKNTGVLSSSSSSSATDFGSDDGDEECLDRISETDLDESQETCDLRNQLGTSSIQSIGTTDPFHTLPLAMPKHIETWLNFYIKIQTTGLIPLEGNEASNPLVTLLVPLAISDQMVMHSLLCIAGLVHSFVQPRNPRTLAKSEGARREFPLYLWHKRQALVAIQKRLNNCAGVMSDEIITAVLLLAGYEFLSREEGHLDEYKHHLNGLSTLVELRGGLECLGLKGFLQQIVSWVELWGSSSNASPLKFRIPSAFDSSNPFFQPPTPHPPGRGFEILGEEDCFQTGIKQALHDLSRIAALYSHYRYRPLGQDELILLVGERTNVEQRFASLTGAIDTVSFPFCPNLLHDLCRIAALLFINRSLRVTEAVSIRTADLMKELFSRIPSAIVRYSSGDESKIVLWSLFIGGTAAMEVGHRTWFVERLAEMRRSFGLCRWEDAKDFLVDYLWSEVHCSASYEKLWKDIIKWEVSKAGFG